MTDVIRCLSECVKSFCNFKTTLFTQDPQGYHKLVPMPTTASLPNGEPRLASAASICFRRRRPDLSNNGIGCGSIGKLKLVPPRGGRCPDLVVAGSRPEPTSIAQSSDPPIRESFVAETSDRPSGNAPTSVSRSAPSPARSHCRSAVRRRSGNDLVASQRQPTTAVPSPRPLPAASQK